MFHCTKSKQSHKLNNSEKSNTQVFQLMCDRLLKFLMIFPIFLSIYLLYYRSLEFCLEGLENCSHRFLWIEKKIEEEIISCILMEIILQLMILKIISKKNLIHIIIILIIFLIYSHGQSFEDHGFYNFFFYIILLLIFTIALLPIDFCVIYFNGKKNRVRIIIIYFLLILFTNIFLIINKFDCNEWPRGLNNTYIENNNSKYGCQIQIPKLCLYKGLEYFQDYTRLFQKNCKNNKNGKKQKVKITKLSNSPYINKTVKRIGYPLLNKITKSIYQCKGHKDILKKLFLNYLVDMDNKKILNKYFKGKMPEVEIDFSNIERPKLVINLHFNKKLSIERKLLEKNSEPYSKNILILYIDSLSRVNALRQLKKTIKFFERFMSYGGNFHKKYSSENFHSFQFFKYHSFRGYTANNYPFLFYGQNLLINKKSFITKFLKKNGYITSEAIDWCGIDNIRACHSFTKVDMFDYFFPLCDPNNDNYNSNRIRCLYDEQNTKHLIEYTNQFWYKYRNNRKYSIILTNSAHEGTLTVVKYLDDMLSNFLNNLFNRNLLKNTIIFLVSDHGASMPSIYYSSDFYRIEEHLPILLIFVNDRKNTTYYEQYKNIYENQQNFITSYDFYNTLGNVIYGNKYKYIKYNSQNKNTCKSPYGISLFDKIYSKTRNPNKYQRLTLFGVSNISCK